MSQDMKYTGQVTLSFGVTDLDAAIAWYTDRLGFELLYKLDDMAWCEMKAPDERISVGLGQREEVQKGGGCVPVWSVEDIDAARAALEAKNVRFDGETQVIPEVVKLATFYDPDGNALMLVESLGKS
jgi:catechol 2,3-dioxygenase-like lactoylglutathione lyase family enzyme